MVHHVPSSYPAVISPQYLQPGNTITPPRMNSATECAAKPSAQADAIARLASLVPLYSGLLTDFRDRLDAAWAPYGGGSAQSMPSDPSVKHPVACDALEPIYQLERIAQELAGVVAGFRQVSG